MIVVHKKGGSVRICGDFRRVNTVTQIDAESILIKQEIFSGLTLENVQ